MNSVSQAVYSVEHYIFSVRFFISVILIIFSVFAWIGIGKLIRKSVINRKDISSNLKGKIHIAETIIKAVATIIIIVVLLQVNGVDVSALLTGMGITSVIIGFALQDMLKDWIMGISIFWNEFFNIGDIIQIDNTVGTVVKLSLKCTKIKDIYTGNIVSISNREILRVQTLSDFVDIFVPVSYEIGKSERHEFIEKMRETIDGMENVSTCDNLGIQEFRASDYTVLLRIHVVDISKKPQTKRDAQNIVMDVYENSEYAIPYGKLDVRMYGG